jgi:UDP-glucose 4-epimerase
LKNKKILVTGGAGYIGSHFVRILGEQGYLVDVLDNLSTGYPENLSRNERLYKVNLSDVQAVDEIMGLNSYNAVVHFAASIVVPESIVKPLDYYWNNTSNLIQVLKHCQKHQINRFVFSSTAAVYGETQTHDLINEKTLTVPTNPYGYSKLMSERVIQDYARANSEFHFGILRYFNVAGADPMGRMGQRNPESTHLIKIACETAVGRRPYMSIFGNDYPTEDGTCIRDYIHVEDLADIHLQTLSYIENSSILLNCGYGRGHSVREVIDTLKKSCRVDFEVRNAPRREGDITKLVADPSLLKNKLNWKPRYDDLESILKHAYQWEKEFL